MSSTPRLSNQWAGRLALLPAAALLSGCIPLAFFAPPTPTATPTPLPPTITMAFPTPVPTATRTPPPSPTPTPDLTTSFGPVLYADSFDTNRGWDIGADAIGGTSLVGGGLTLSVRPGGILRTAVAPAPPVGDFYLEARLRTEICSPRDEFGLMFRLGPDLSHYRFALTCDGAWKVVLVLPESARGLVPLTFSPEVVAGTPADNRLAIWASGSTFLFFVNGIEVFNLRNRLLTTGTVGFFVRARSGGQVTVTFDDLVLRPLLPTPIPTPQP